MAPPPSRPTTEIGVVILDSMDQMFGRLVDRLDGLTDDEYLWEPAAGAWSVRPVGDRGAVDGAGVRDIDPAPVTTIAWRLWHIALDCLDDYARRFRGDQSAAPSRWTLEAAEAVEMLQDSWQAYRAEVAGRDWWDPLGPDWGPWADHSVADMALHAGNELVHHGAEIALLRDLYRAGSGSD